MEERKTAAIVLSVLVLIVIFFTMILPYIRHKGTQTLSFNACTIHFEYFDKGLEDDTYRAAKNKLALCLCNVYQKKPDTAVANQILGIYRLYGNHNGVDSASYNRTTNLDSIIKNKSMVFDTLVYVD
jgi:hypothetical protein